MFEQTIVASRPGLDRRWIPLAALVHAGALVLLLMGQAWQVGEVPTPIEDLVFVVWSPPVLLTVEAPKPPVRHARPPRPTADRTEAAPPAVAPVTVPPTTVPTDLPPLDHIDGFAAAAALGEDPSSLVPTGDAVDPGGDFLPLSIGMTPPAVLHRVEPAYTEAARRARRQGLVVLELHVGTTGEVVAVDVVRPLGFGLDDEAVRAVRQWRFAPALQSGRPIGVIYTITVRFELR